MVNGAKRRKSSLTVNQYVAGILDSDIAILSKAITVIESALKEDIDLAQQIIEKCLTNAGDSIRIGVSGVPGVGKSTFIDTFGTYLTDEFGKKVAVLTVDPSSQTTKGSILGDKVRMTNLSKNSRAYVRSSPSSGFPGGVTSRMRETIILCEAAGFDVVVVETVGVGQSEIAVNSIVDFFLLLHLAGAGDELQGIKRGIMEFADAVVVNKSDGANVHGAELAKKEIESALKLFPLPDSGWKPRVLTCSSLENKGIDVVWSVIEKYFELIVASGYFAKNRRKQASYHMHETVVEMLKDNFYKHDGVRKFIDRMERDVMDGKLSPFHAADKLARFYRVGQQ